MLLASVEVEDLCRWLQEVYLPLIISQFNQVDVRKRLGLYGGERIPENERNLTDTRNRVSLIIEYEVARISNKILNDESENDLFWCYVVANRFPDLEVRSPSGERHLRVEVKCLQSIAEENAANFDTLRKDINPKTDFVVVFLWEWKYDGEAGPVKWDRAPFLLRGYVFHAASLALLRDHYWLNRPPRNLGDGHQGFDLRYAVNCVGGVYSEEEGNYGKLLRLWKEGFPYRPPMTPILEHTERQYLAFKSAVVMEGFLSLCAIHLGVLAPGQPINVVIDNGGLVGYRSSDFSFFLKSAVSTPRMKEIVTELGTQFVVVMTDKYVTTGYRMTSGRLQKWFGPIKPKSMTKNQFDLL